MRVVFRPIEVWPEPQTRQRQRARFDTGYESTKNLLERECRFLGAREIVIQVAIPESDIRLDGSYPKATARSSHPGVIVSFESKHGALRYATDTFGHWQDNLRAIALGLEALRKVDRYGISKGGEQYTGWRAIGSGQEAVEGPMTADYAARFMSEASGLTVLVGDGEDDLAAAYRAASKTLHPDVGGDPELFRKLTDARDLLLSHRGPS